MTASPSLEALAKAEEAAGEAIASTANSLGTCPRTARCPENRGLLEVAAEEVAIEAASAEVSPLGKVGRAPELETIHPNLSSHHGGIRLSHR